MMRTYKVELSDIPTDKFMLRYLSGSTEGIAIITIGKNLKKNIARAKLLADIGSGVIQGLNTISLQQKNHQHIIFLEPETNLEALVSETFADEFYQWKKQFWYVKAIAWRKRKAEMPIEVSYVDLRNTGILVTAHLYIQTKLITAPLFTAYIPYEELGI